MARLLSTDQIGVDGIDDLTGPHRQVNHQRQAKFGARWRRRRGDRGGIRRSSVPRNRGGRVEENGARFGERGDRRGGRGRLRRSGGRERRRRVILKPLDARQPPFAPRVTSVVRGEQVAMDRDGVPRRPCRAHSSAMVSVANN